MKTIRGTILTVLASTIATLVHAGQAPGVPNTWNGPWGGGYLNGESYNPLRNPYIGAGYPIGGPPPYGPPSASPYSMQQPSMPAEPKPLPGGGFLLPPGAGGGMIPGSYSNH